MLETSASSGNPFLGKEGTGGKSGDFRTPYKHSAIRRCENRLLSLFRLLGSVGLSRSRRDEPKRSTFVNCYMLRFVTLDEILGCFS